ncbi:MAG: penicillin-binding protein 2 [Bacteroidales bacterium]|nr:MAG: penicillin-binding protein 2 [Bacteroidales bacterium]
MILVFLLYVVRLFSLQVIDKSYRLTASTNVLRYVTQYPARGLIYDRAGNLLVYNEAAYDLMVNPAQMSDFDTLDFCSILGLTVEDVRNKIESARAYSQYTSSPFLKLISSETYAILQEKLYKFPGFFVQVRTLRKYPADIAAHILGYVGEVDEETMERNPYYKLGDYIGISGIEKSYEEVLRGRKGVEIFLVDVHNRIKGSYMNGRFDTTVAVGTDIAITIHSGLQAYGEKLMRNKIGSIVAIEPSSGEILMLVSSPTYDPSLMVGRIRSENFLNLSQDSLKPLFNRALMAQYPPGSTFKLMNGLIGLQERVLYPGTEYYCDFGYYVGNFRVGCHNHDSPLNLTRAVQNSCNAYFCYVFRSVLDNPRYESVREGFWAWSNYIRSFGFGDKLNSDFTNELKGLVPTDTLYDSKYGRDRWQSLMLVSLAIGQGELGTTPLQMANMTSAIANRGYYYIPHIIKNIGNSGNIDARFLEKHRTEIDSIHFIPILNGMDLAVNGEPGTGSTARSASIPGIRVCGKTGTAENPHGEDHSIFVAFAPKNNPEIALAVYVENGGFGATYAAPLASLIIEKYLTDTISRPWVEERILNTDLIHLEKESEHMDQ